MAKVPFPLVLEAVEKGERAQWAIGDALVKEIDDNSTSNFRDCASMLDDRGFDYSEATLKTLKRTAEAFPKSSRHDDISWNAHHECGAPETLERVIKLIHGPITVKAARLVMTEWREKEIAAREAKHAEATKSHKAAKAEHKKALTEKAKSKAGSQERKDADRRAQQAKEQERAAAAEMKASTKMPKPAEYSAETEPLKGDLAIMAEVLALAKEAGKVTKTLKDNLKRIDKIFDDLTEAQADSLVEEHEPVLTVATQIMDRFKAKRSRFTVHRGGAA